MAIRRVSRAFSRVGILRRYADHKAIRAEPGSHGVWVSPVPAESLSPEILTLAKVGKVEPARIPGYWVHQNATEPTSKVIKPAGPDEKVLYAMHGGAYVLMSAHPNDRCGMIGKDLLRRVDSGPALHRVFSIEYRLSTVLPFPAQLIDALSGYHYLVDTLGFDPKNIILVGDSAGGNLALALSRYLVEYNSSITPGGMVLLSPWCDLGREGQDTESMFVNTSDFIVRQYPNAGAFLTAPFGYGMANHSRWISPALVGNATWNFKGFPKTLILAGGAEILRDQIRELRRKMEKDLGDEKVQYLELEDAVHDWLIFPRIEPETQIALETIAKWVKEM